jgi:hypothetical protein
MASLVEANTISKAEISVWLRNCQVLLAAFGNLERKPVSAVFSDNAGALPLKLTVTDADGVSKSVDTTGKRVGW